MKIYPLLSCASARDKLIKVKAYIKTESGSAVIRLRMNGKVLEYTPVSYTHLRAHETSHDHV